MPPTKATSQWSAGPQEYPDLYAFGQLAEQVPDPNGALVARRRLRGAPQVAVLGLLELRQPARSRQPAAVAPSYRPLDALACPAVKALDHGG
jgi:hypothetical protein